jgi:uncharacterized protein DUF4124
MKKLFFLCWALAVGDAAAAFRCVDEKGTTHIGDTPPAACAKVPMYEIGRTGSVLRKIDPTPSAEEVKAREAEAAERKERERAAAEQRRKDMALLSTYSTPAEFDVARDRNVEPVQGRIKSAQERIEAVEKRAQELADEMEFYKAGKSKVKKKGDAPVREVPIQLTTDYERVTSEKSALALSIVGYEKEMVEIRQKFELDKRRWLELKSNPALLKGDPPPTPGALPVNAAKGSVKCGEKMVNCRKGESFLCLKQDGTWHTVACEAKS